MSILSVFDHSRPEQPNKVLSYPEDIASTLAAVGVRFERWQASAPIRPGAGQNEVLEACRPAIDRLMAEGGYRAVDLISVTDDHPQKVELRGQFFDEHRHAEDEVRLFVAGRGLFNLHIGDYVYALLCEKGDLIVVPAGTAHWFDMGEAPRFVTIRLFNRPEGLDAEFTGNDIARHFPQLEE